MKFLRLVFLLALFSTSSAVAAETSKSSGLVTEIVREVNLLLAHAEPRRAELNEHVREGTAVRTGSDSRAELTFSDLTITRLGANSLFSFRKAGREAQLNTGSLLLRVPKNSGGATVISPAITAGVTGTTFIVELARSGGARVTVLEGSVRVALVGDPRQRRDIRAGQKIDVPPHAMQLPEPRQADVAGVMRTSSLINGFRPLPSLGSIGATIQQQQQQQQPGPQGTNPNGPNRGPGGGNMGGPAGPPGGGGGGRP